MSPMKLIVDTSTMVGQPGMKPILESIKFETIEVESPFERSSHITLKHVGIPIPNVVMHRDLVTVESVTNKPAHKLSNYPPHSCHV